VQQENEELQREVREKEEQMGIQQKKQENERDSFNRRLKMHEQFAEEQEQRAEGLQRELEVVSQDLQQELDTQKSTF